MTKKNLQKLTESELKIDEILKLEKITNDDLKDLTPEETKMFNRKLNEKIKDLKDIKRDEFFEQIEAITEPEMKNRLWEYNHTKIVNTIIDEIQRCGYMPHQSSIAEITGLSRQTIHKHIKELPNNELYQHYKEQFQFMFPKLMGELMRSALKGDIKATRLLLEYTVENPAKKIGTQNNYIQINGMIFTEEKLKQLPAEQLKAIEAILTAAPDKIIECETTEKENRFTN